MTKNGAKLGERELASLMHQSQMPRMNKTNAGDAMNTVRGTNTSKHPDIFMQRPGVLTMNTPRFIAGALLVRNPNHAQPTGRTRTKTEARQIASDVMRCS